MKTLLLVFLVCFSLSAQPKLEFEVAAIKPAEPGAQGTRFQLQPGGTLAISNATLKQLIRQAYQLRSFQLDGGPAWAGSERFDVWATSNESFTKLEGLNQGDLEGIRDRMLARARNLLADRFGVVLRKELREQPVYVLTVTKAGHRLKLAEGDISKRGTSVRGDNGRVQVKATSLDMGTFVYTLADSLERAVLDRTGLTGNYDFEVDWVQDLNQPVDGPSVFTALQEQLGLKLEATKAPVEVYVIEKAEHPSEN